MNRKSFLKAGFILATSPGLLTEVLSKPPAVKPGFKTLIIDLNELNDLYKKYGTTDFKTIVAILRKERPDMFHDNYHCETVRIKVGYIVTFKQMC